MSPPLFSILHTNEPQLHCESEAERKRETRGIVRRSGTVHYGTSQPPHFPSPRRCTQENSDGQRHPISPPSLAKRLGRYRPIPRPLALCYSKLFTTQSRRAARILLRPPCSPPRFPMASRFRSLRTSAPRTFGDPVLGHPGALRYFQEIASHKRDPKAQSRPASLLSVEPLPSPHPLCCSGGLHRHVCIRQARFGGRASGSLWHPLPTASPKR